MGQHGKDFSTELIVVGDFGAPFGVNGWLKINSYTEPKHNIWNFEDWFIKVNEDNSLPKGLEVNCSNIKVKRIKESRKKFLVLLAGILDRCAASSFTNKKILVNRSFLPMLPKDQYYWIDLLGSKVYDLTNRSLGVLDYVFHNGANDVMVIKGEGTEYLIPYSLEDVVIRVDVIKKIITVKWDLDY